MSKAFVGAFGQVETGGFVEASSHLVELDRTLVIHKKQGEQAARLGRGGRSLSQAAVVTLFNGDLKVLPALLLKDHAHSHPWYGMKVVVKSYIEGAIHISRIATADTSEAAMFFHECE